MIVLAPSLLPALPAVCSLPPVEGRRAFNLAPLRAHGEDLDGVRERSNDKMGRDVGLLDADGTSRILAGERDHDGWTSIAQRVVQLDILESSRPSAADGVGPNLGSRSERNPAATVDIALRASQSAVEVVDGRIAAAHYAADTVGVVGGGGSKAVGNWDRSSRTRASVGHYSYSSCMPRIALTTRRVLGVVRDGHGDRKCPNIFMAWDSDENFLWIRVRVDDDALKVGWGGPAQRCDFGPKLQRVQGGGKSLAIEADEIGAPAAAVEDAVGGGVTLEEGIASGDLGGVVQLLRGEAAGDGSCSVAMQARSAKAARVARIENLHPLVLTSRRSLCRGAQSTEIGTVPEVLEALNPREKGLRHGWTIDEDVGHVARGKVTVG